MTIFLLIVAVLCLVSISSQIKHLHNFLYDWRNEMNGKNELEDLDLGIDDENTA